MEGERGAYEKLDEPFYIEGDLFETLDFLEKEENSRYEV